MDILHDRPPFVNKLLKKTIRKLQQGLIEANVMNSSLSAASVLGEVLSSLASVSARTKARAGREALHSLQSVDLCSAI